MNILKSKDSVKKSNLVFLINDQKDLAKLDFLSLNNEIVLHIDSAISEGKNNVLEYFLWGDKFKKLFIILHLERNKSKMTFLGDALRKLPTKLTILSNEKSDDIDLIDACVLGKYKYEEYKKDKTESEYNFVVKNDNEDELIARVATLKNVCLSRDMVNRPTCDKTPEKIEKYVKSLNFKNTKIRVLDYEDIKKEGLNLIEAVWRASINKPKLIIFERIVDENLPTYWFIGKGIVFDTGWINLKPTSGLFDMKWDMGGSAQVIHTMLELDDKDLNINIIWAVPLAENSVSENAYRPSDIITAYNGKTVEIINTDAEWRLVLADAISYVSKNYKTSAMMTTATLTWACLHALGFNYTAVMGTDNKVVRDIVALSDQGEEKYLELPMDEYHIEKTKWDISDLKNLADWVYAWSSMWGAFLVNFVENGEDLTHLDIAWTSDRKDDYSIFVRWATGVWVDSLSKYYISLWK